MTGILVLMTMMGGSADNSVIRFASVVVTALMVTLAMVMSISCARLCQQQFRHTNA